MTESISKDLTEPIRIGMICSFWLPRHGGGEQYDHRLAIALKQQGFDVRVFTGTSESEDRDNGGVAVTRHVADGDLLHSSWKMVHSAPKDSLHLSKLMIHYDFMSAAVDWCIRNQIQIALIGNPLQQVELAHARELYLQLKRLGIKTGIIHFDLASQIEKTLLQTYLSYRSWATAKTIVQTSIQKIRERLGRTHTLQMIGSPLFFEPDFVISCSEWSAAFIDPEETTPKVVLHPILDRSHWTNAPRHQEPLDYREILMINPSHRKGPKLMASLIWLGPSNWRFRVLKGGWGDAFSRFPKDIQGSEAFRDQRVELADYFKDIRAAYRAAGLVFFPSYYEGYGMTAVEPMYAGTPVVSSNYPAILEAVGSGALTLCPHLDHADRWKTAVKEVLDHRSEWSARALERSTELEARQKKEIASFAGFLRQIARAPENHGASGRN